MSGDNQESAFSKYVIIGINTPDLASLESKIGYDTTCIAAHEGNTSDREFRKSEN